MDDQNFLNEPVPQQGAAAPREPVAWRRKMVDATDWIFTEREPVLVSDLWIKEPLYATPPAAAPTQVAGSEVDHVHTGITDKNGRELLVGDRIVILLNGPHHKKEYWDPEYEVTWKAPSFGIRWVGGGKHSSAAAWYFGLGTKQGSDMLETLVSAPNRPPQPAALNEPSGNSGQLAGVAVAPKFAIGDRVSWSYEGSQLTAVVDYVLGPTACCGMPLYDLAEIGRNDEWFQQRVPECELAASPPHTAGETP